MRALLLILLILSSCAIHVKKDYDEDFDFRSLQTYAWAQDAPDESSQSDNSLIRKRIHSNVNRILSSKGIKKVSKSEADFLIDYMYQSREVLVPSVIQPSIGVGYGFNRSAFGGFGVGYGGVTEREIEILQVNVIRPKDNALIWTGKTEDTDLRASTPEKTSENFEEALEAILKSFPPQN